MIAPSKLHVLVVEPDAADARRFRSTLEAGGRGPFRTTVAGGLKEAEPVLPRADLVLLDLDVPDGAGLEGVDRVRARAPRAPLVVLSDSRDEETAFRCLQHGAQDVLVKDGLDSDALLRSLHCAMERQALAAERDAALVRARNGEESLRRILAASIEGVAVCDPGGRTLFVNPAAEVLLGWAPGSGTGRPLNLPLDGEGPVELERRGTGGEIRTLELATARIAWEGGEAVLASLHDLTARRRLEEDRRAAEARRREAEALGALGRLAGGIAHGLNNQLTVVLGFASLALEKEGSEGPLRSHVAAIHDAAWKAADMVKQLTACAGRQPALPERVDLNEVVGGLRERIESMALEGIETRWDLHGEPLPLRADRRLIEQALLAMVEHARDSMPGGGDLTVSTGLLPPSRRHGPPRSTEGVFLAVSDTGPGLGAEARRRLFEPFYTTDVLGIGSGLGLAPLHGIAQQCGGRVEVYGGWSRGTTLRVVLPPVEDDAPPEASGAAPAARETPGADSLPKGSETVLVVEEDVSFREMITSSLRDLGYRVLGAADAGDAVRAAMAWDGPISLLVAGYRAPGLRGPVLARVLRCRKPDMRAIYMASESEVDATDVASTGPDRLLPKPFELRDLALEARRLLDVSAPVPIPTAPPAADSAGAP